MADSGYIKLYRQLLNWCWWHDRNTRDLFIYLLLAANWEEKQFHDTTVKRGQLITSVASLSKNVGISTKSVRVALEHLKTTNEVAIETTNRWTLITVVNYEKYQSVDLKRASKRANYATNEGQTKGKQRATTKEDKEDKEYNNQSVKKDGSVSDRLTDDEYSSLEAKLTPEDVVLLFDTIDEKMAGRLQEIKHPYKYCLKVAREMGLIP